MEPLKEMFNSEFYRHFSNVIEDTYANFNGRAFLKEVTDNLEPLSLNERLRKTTITLRQYLPSDYKKAMNILFKAAPSLKTGYTALVLPDFVALYGKDHFDLSLEGLKYFTVFGSSEFAIRVFLKSDLKKTLREMNSWAEDKNHHVRRLSSEGSRPRLPWSFRLDELIKNPGLTSNILEKLKADEELYVKRSVANHLNDISKDNTGFMLQLIKSWDHQNPHTQWIIKHANRNLIKKGHKDSLAIFNFEKDVRIKVDKLKLNKSAIGLGDSLQFEFSLESAKATSQKLVVDYAIHYVKASGGLSKKIFKLKELILHPGQKVQLTKTQVFKDLTTRKHYHGKHLLEILINGKPMATKNFRLIKG